MAAKSSGTEFAQCLRDAEALAWILPRKVFSRNTIRKRISLKEPRKTLEIKQANGIPIMALGRVLLMHASKLRRPIPGSITTGGAPRRKSAKANRISPYPGRTISKTRSPFRIPCSWRTIEQPLTSFSSCAKDFGLKPFSF